MKIHYLSAVVLSIGFPNANCFSERDHGEVDAISKACSHWSRHAELVNQTYTLPNPFELINGDAVETLEDWNCRRAQIRELFQKHELGRKPPRPPKLTSFLSKNDTLHITAGFSKSNSITFFVPIAYPNTTSRTGPFPAVIVYDFPSVPIPPGVATITLSVADIAEQDDLSSRGVGLFYDLYGNTTSSAGALMAWAWAVSRIIDVLEDHPEYKIDPSRIAVTGCSRNGKGAMVAGAFDDRIALTIPQESGSGGDACWRTSRDMLVNQHLVTQTAWEIVDENVWFSQNFDYFGQDNYTVGLLPVDHHELAGLVAPRGLYSTSNIGFLWLGGWSCWECMTAARSIYSALGAASSHGFSQDGPHDHCSFPGDQVSEIMSFYDRFLLDQEVETDVFRTVGNWTFDPSWTPWLDDVPDLVK